MRDGGSRAGAWIANGVLLVATGCLLLVAAFAVHAADVRRERAGFAARAFCAPKGLRAFSFSVSYAPDGKPIVPVQCMAPSGLVVVARDLPL